MVNIVQKTRTRRSGALFWVGALYGAVFTAVVALVLVITNPFAARTTNATAESFGVAIEWVDQLPCDDYSDAGGCWREITPDTIYVKSDLPAEYEQYVVLHEIGHVLQHRLGQPTDECQADRFAQSMGTVLGSYCS